MNLPFARSPVQDKCPNLRVAMMLVEIIEIALFRDALSELNDTYNTAPIHVAFHHNAVSTHGSLKSTHVIGDRLEILDGPSRCFLESPSM
jgi:hypothetical protein